ncbi:unnamed protein product [Brassica rapa subsp. trilocularis]
MQLCQAASMSKRVPQTPRIRAKKVEMITRLWGRITEQASWWVRSPQLSNLSLVGQRFNRKSQQRKECFGIPPTIQTI